MKSDFLIALTQLAAERNLPREIVLSAIEDALKSAYRKDSATAGMNISVKLDPGTGDVSVHVLKFVVEEIENPQLEILLADARKIKSDAEIGDSIATDSMPHSAGRIAAQTAKQVVMQRLREAEREIIYEEFAEKEGEVFSVTVQRLDSKQLTVELGRAEALLPTSEQIPSERYRVGNKMKVLLQAVQRSSKGPELIVSRTDKLLLKRLFEMEVPEIYSGAVEIMGIAREAGSRSKVAVRATQAGVDPVGSCVGLRGVRIQNIVNELQGEKIDVIEWNKDPGVLIANALNPSQVMRVELNSDEETAIAVVPERQLSLAIGKEGQNARLAAKLTGWKVDIRSNVEADAVAAEKPVIDKVVLPPDEEVALPAVIKEAIEEIVEAVAEPAAAEVATEVKEEAAPEPVVAEVVEVAAEVIAEAEQAVEAPVAEAAPVAEPEVAVEEEQETPEEEPVEAEEEPATATVDEVEPEKERVREPVAPVMERSTSLRDLPDSVWSLRRGRGAPAETGRIRFAEDIADLRRNQRTAKGGSKKRRR
ncbi:MAG: transcription termination/antitermination protein NusA [Chloroflexi bacterium]|nr:transcription termination/antitermination protein NusA [Chloroflexota bacterium]